MASHFDEVTKPPRDGPDQGPQPPNPNHQHQHQPQPQQQQQQPQQQPQQLNPYGQPVQGYPAAAAAYGGVVPGPVYGQPCGDPYAAAGVGVGGAYGSPPPPPPPYGVPQGGPPYGGAVPYGYVQAQPMYAPYAAAPVFAPGPGGRSGDNDAIIAVIVFIAGFFCCPLWCGGFAFLRSRNSVAKLFSVLSLVMCAVTLVILVVIVIVVATTAKVSVCDSRSPSNCFSSSCSICVTAGTGYYSNNATCTATSACTGTRYASRDQYCQSLRSPYQCQQAACAWCSYSGYCEPSLAQC